MMPKRIIARVVDRADKKIAEVLLVHTPKKVKGQTAAKHLRS